MTPHPYGRHAVLLLLDEPAEVRPWLEALEVARIPGVRDIVAGAQSVVLVGDPDLTDASRLTAALPSVEHFRRNVAGSDRPSEVVEVPVVYDGEDLDEVARLTGLQAHEVIARHSEATYEVAFCGFAPGFAYLTGLPAELALPRRETPRPQVPAGSVAIAAGYSAVYPQASPGGWWLLGRTDLPVWDVDRDPPALFRPGGLVRFTAVP